jgi:hypothetical protein
MELIPLWIKLSYTAFVVVTVAVYAVKYPLWNFLWFSDIALILTVPALWLESSLLASMMLVGAAGALLNASFFWRLLTGMRLAGLTDTSSTRRNRGISGRSRCSTCSCRSCCCGWLRGSARFRLLIAQTLLAWVVLPPTYRWRIRRWKTSTGHSADHQAANRMPPLAYLGLVMIDSRSCSISLPMSCYSGCSARVSTQTWVGPGQGSRPAQADLH